MQLWKNFGYFSEQVIAVRAVEFVYVRWLSNRASRGGVNIGAR